MERKVPWYNKVLETGLRGGGAVKPSSRRPTGPIGTEVSSTYRTSPEAARGKLRAQQTSEQSTDVYIRSELQRKKGSAMKEGRVKASRSPDPYLKGRTRMPFEIPTGEAVARAGKQGRLAQKKVTKVAKKK